MSAAGISMQVSANEGRHIMPATDFPGALPAQAQGLAADPRLFAAFNAAIGDVKLRELGLRDPGALLAQFEVPLPKGLSVVFFEGQPPMRAYPFGDGWFPTIVLTNCRTVWVRNCKPTLDRAGVRCTFDQEETCFGYEIVPGRWIPPVG
jgi:hypothetical protein